MVVPVFMGVGAVRPVEERKVLRGVREKEKPVDMEK